MTAPKLPHCAVRAKERYGIDLSWADVHELRRRCQAGEGFTGDKQDGTRFHTIVFAGAVLWVVYKPPGLSRHECGTVVTIMPPTVATSVAQRDRRHMQRRTGRYERRRRGWT